MSPTPLEQIIPQLRDAIGPVILISGVGLLLLTMTTRLGRAIDRARQLKHELSLRTGREREQTLAQVTILYRRSTIIRLSIYPGGHQRRAGYLVDDRAFCGCPVATATWLS